MNGHTAGMANLVTNELPTTATEGPSLQSTQGKQNASQRSKCKYKTSRKDKLRQMRTCWQQTTFNFVKKKRVNHQRPAIKTSKFLGGASHLVLSNNCEANEDVLATANMDQ